MCCYLLPFAVFGIIRILCFQVLVVVVLSSHLQNMVCAVCCFVRIYISCCLFFVCCLLFRCLLFRFLYAYCFCCLVFVCLYIDDVFGIVVCCFWLEYVYMMCLFMSLFAVMGHYINLMSLWFDCCCFCLRICIIWFVLFAVSVRVYI